MFEATGRHLARWASVCLIAATSRCICSTTFITAGNVMFPGSPDPGAGVGGVTPTAIVLGGAPGAPPSPKRMLPKLRSISISTAGDLLRSITLPYRLVTCLTISVSFFDSATMIPPCLQNLLHGPLPLSLPGHQRDLSALEHRRCGVNHLGVGVAVGKKIIPHQQPAGLGIERFVERSEPGRAAFQRSRQIEQKRQSPFAGRVVAPISGIEM